MYKVTIFNSRTGNLIAYAENLFSLRRYMKRIGNQRIEKIGQDLSSLVSTKAPKVVKADNFGPLPSLFGPATAPETLAPSDSNPYLSYQPKQQLEGIQYRQCRPIPSGDTMVMVYGQMVTSERAATLRSHPRLQPKPWQPSARLAAESVAICHARGAQVILRNLQRCLAPAIEPEGAAE